MEGKDHDCLYDPCPICAAAEGNDELLDQVTPRVTVPPDESDPPSNDIEIDEAFAILWDRTHDDDDDDDDAA